MALHQCLHFTKQEMFLGNHLACIDVTPAVAQFCRFFFLGTTIMYQVVNSKHFNLRQLHTSTKCTSKIWLSSVLTRCSDAVKCTDHDVTTLWCPFWTFRSLAKEIVFTKNLLVCQLPKLHSYRAIPYGWSTLWLALVVRECIPLLYHVAICKVKDKERCL